MSALGPLGPIGVLTFDIFRNILFTLGCLSNLSWVPHSAPSLQMLLLFLLVFSTASAAEEAGGQEVGVRNGTSEVSRDWRCPNTTVKMMRGQEIHCHCELAHTLRSVYSRIIQLKVAKRLSNIINHLYKRHTEKMAPILKSGLLASDIHNSKTSVLRYLIFLSLTF